MNKRTQVYNHFEKIGREDIKLYFLGDVFTLLSYVVAHRVARDATQMPTKTKAPMKIYVLLLAVFVLKGENDYTPAVFVYKGYDGLAGYFAGIVKIAGGILLIYIWKR